MQVYESLYIIGIFIIIVSIIFYILSTTMIANPDENSVTNLLGKTTEIDTTFATEETLSGLKAERRQGNRFFLWIGIPLGIGIFLAGIIIKRRKEGPDLFIDDGIEDEEEKNLPSF